MSILKKLFGKEEVAVAPNTTDVSVEPKATIETVVIEDPVKKPFINPILRPEVVDGDAPLVGK